MSRPRPRPLVLTVLALATLLAACAPAVGAPEPSSAPGTASPAAPVSLPSEVPVAEASALRDAGAYVLDVREPHEWVAGHIPGAALIPLGELGASVADVPTDRQVVVICRTGRRSAQGRDILLAAGHPAVTSMAGGMNDWTAADYPVVTGG